MSIEGQPAPEMTDTPPGPRLRGRRVALCALIFGFFGILGGLSFGLIRFEEDWKRLEMKALPAPTEAVRDAAHALRSPEGLFVLTLALVACLAAVLLGRWDPWLGRLTLVFAVLNFGVALLFVAAIYLPTLRSGPQSID